MNNVEYLYIKGIPGKGNEVIELLKSFGGINKYDYEGDNSDLLYFIDNSNDKTILTVAAEGKLSQCVKIFGEEVILPEYLVWDDNNQKIEGYKAEDVATVYLHNKKYSIFDTFGQAKSACAAAMISQIRTI